MKEPRPLLREGATDFERQLLSSVMRERPSAQLHSRMRRTLGLTGPLAWASSVKAMLAGLAGKSAVGAVVVGLVAAGAVGVAYTRGSDSDAASEAVRPSAAPPAAAPVVSAPATAAAPQTPSVAAPNGDLREEILLLDQARAALQSGSSATALEHLDQYGNRFPSGVLSREAAQLRQQAGALRSSTGRKR